MIYDHRKAYGYPKEWAVPSRNNPESNQPGALMDPTPSNTPSDYAAAIRESAPMESVEPMMDYKESNQPYE